jgi:hypothetical protein
MNTIHLCKNPTDNTSLQRRMGAMALTGVMSICMSPVISTLPTAFCTAQIVGTLALTLLMDLFRVRDVPWGWGPHKRFCLIRASAVIVSALTLQSLTFPMLSALGIWQNVAIYRLGSVPFKVISSLPIWAGGIGYLRPTSYSGHAGCRA